MTSDVPLRERWRRFVCSLIGHRYAYCKRGEPVVLFQACTRCGKWKR